MRLNKFQRLVIHPWILGLAVAATTALPVPSMAVDPPVPKGTVTLCHQPGTPAEKTLVLPLSAALGHMKHGDKDGACNVVPTTAAIIGPAGGRLAISGYGAVAFPAGAFETDQRVVLSVTSNPETNDVFLDTAFMFGAESRLPYEFRVNTGGVAPKTSFEVTFDVPETFRSAVPAGSEIRFFGENYWSGSNETLDTFEVFQGRFTSTDTTVSASLPLSLFSTGLSGDGTYQAIVTLGVTPTARPTLPAPAPLTVNAAGAAAELLLPVPDDALTINRVILAQKSGDPCQGSTLRAPLDGDPPITSSYGPRDPIIGSGNFHYGTDYGVPNGTPVYSMADGVVERVNVQTSRTTGQPTGWGQYVLVRHRDGSRSLYAHMELGSVSVSPTDTVSAGDVIGPSDTSGTATGPHLHIEYAPNGQIFDKDSKVDPVPCIGGNVSGSITVRDNGVLADDAFIVAIDGREVCRTGIGASNTCAVGNLRPGVATLSLTAFIAPDDVGTYEITLAEGLRFSDGSIQRSGTLPQGGAVSFTISIPDQP